ncbi:Pr6Pr family membrane protein [Microbacteriaceae bacterium VKM Ac-2854]|nr:Pr6Pr family membrane protein [Microbacteriaceae bacterium VKM Ac-2854]
MRITFVLLRVAVAAAVLLAVGVNLADSIAFWEQARFRDVPALITNFFSYLTILSILASAVVLLVGAARLALDRLPDSRGFAFARASVVSYMAIVCVVYNVLLRGTAVTGAGQGQQWTNEVMHVVVPLYLVLDWFLAPGRIRLPWRTVPQMLIAPVLWLTYTLVRAPLVYDQFKHEQGWYPYPFLDPNRGGVLSVAVYIVAMAVVFSSVAAVTTAVSRWPHLRALPAAASVEAEKLRTI